MSSILRDSFATSLLLMRMNNKDSTSNMWQFNGKEGKISAQNIWENKSEITWLL